MQYGSSNIYILEFMTNVNFKKKLVKYLDQKVKYQQIDFITGNTHVNYQSSSTHNSDVINEVKLFKSKPDSKSRSQCQNCWFPWKRFVTINTHVKNQSSSTHCSKVISKVKIFQR